MAGDWIKMRNNLWDDPRVSRLCDLTEASEAAIIGGLYWLWSSADEHTEDGFMPGLSTAGIDRKTGIKGFGAALVLIGWIDDSQDGITINRFDEHNGASAKRRCMDAQRKANSRNLSASDADNSQTDSGQDAPECGAREEKRREEKSKPLKSTSRAEANANASRLPADWSPSPDDVLFCKTERPDLDPETTANRFRDYWISQPGQRGKKLDWQATWRNWVRNEKAWNPARAGPHRKTVGEERAETIAALTGRNRIDERPTAAERDITGECARIA